MAYSKSDLMPGVRAALLACHKLRTQQRESETESEYLQRDIVEMFKAMNGLIDMTFDEARKGHNE